MSQQKPKPKVARLVTKHDTKKKSISVLPKNPAQKNYLDTLWSKAEQVVVFGPSGTGKTYLVSTVAASLYNTKDVNKIVITRPHVAVGEKLGFLPGDLREKCEPWALPVLDVLDTHLGKGAVDTGIKNGNIEVSLFSTGTSCSLIYVKVTVSLRSSSLSRSTNYQSLSLSSV